MVSGIMIRPAEPDDAEPIATLRKRVDQDQKNKNPPLDPSGGSYPTIEQQREELAQNSVCFVALVDEQVVGFAVCSGMDRLPGDYLFSLTVDSAARRRGIGTALVSRLLIWAKSHSEVETLTCRFARADRSTRRILENAGFKVVRVGWVYFMQGAMYNAIDMVLEIR